MSLFFPDVLVTFTDDEWQIFMRPINAAGGAQGHLTKLRACQVAELQLLVPVNFLDTAHHYAYDYGDGGFQQRFRVLCAAALRTGQWTPTDSTPKRATNSGGAFGKAK